MTIRNNVTYGSVFTEMLFKQFPTRLESLQGLDLLLMKHKYFMSYSLTCMLRCTILTISFYSDEAKEKRSLLDGVNNAICQISDRNYGFMGFAGTSFILRQQRVLSSSVGKEVNLLVIDDFPYLTVEDAWRYLSERLDLTGCEAVKESNEMKKLEGRPRLSGLTIQLLSTRKNQSGDKAQMLKDAIKESFAKHCKTIELLLRKFSTTHHIEVYETLKRLCCR